MMTTTLDSLTDANATVAAFVCTLLAENGYTAYSILPTHTFVLYGGADADPGVMRIYVERCTHRGTWAFAGHIDVILGELELDGLRRRAASLRRMLEKLG